MSKSENFDNEDPDNEDPDNEDPDNDGAIETGSAPQPLDFPGADAPPPGRPDGDEDPALDPDQGADSDED
ncbi:MAG TPA: hypothetical protein VHO01_00650 [Jatrophihabitans sp.]|nr:hypothetical protein [Jatrophihabitans sp.]